MKRRKFLKDTLTGLPLLFLTPTLLASCGNDVNSINPNGKTVVVIGGGISGLAAAKKMKEKGFSVIVLEAQEKIGGRMRTDRSLGVAFDEGASWIHGPSGNPITSLNFAGLTNLQYLDCSSNSLLSLNASSLTNLKTLISVGSRDKQIFYHYSKLLGNIISESFLLCHATVQ